MLKSNSPGPLSLILQNLFGADMDSNAVLTAKEFATRMPDFKSSPEYDAGQEERTEHSWWKLNQQGVYGVLKDISKSVTNVMQCPSKDDRELKHPCFISSMVL